MKIKELTLSMSEIVPTGDFKNTRPHMSITWEGEIDFAQAQAELKERFNAWLPSIINKAEHNARVVEETRSCPIHTAPMTSRISKKTGKPYFAHTAPDGSLCFGSYPK